MNIDKILSSNCLIHRPYSSSHFANHCNGDPTREHRLREVVMFCESPSIWNSSSAFPLDSCTEYNLPFCGTAATCIFPHVQSQAMPFGQECHRNNAALHSSSPQETHKANPFHYSDFNLAHLPVQFLSDFSTIFTKI